ncbi:MAG: glutaredoxin domain-containing protein [Gudongella sp.]|nr:glutaredoxin domain-containing protein [Gudongella sp.]
MIEIFGAPGCSRCKRLTMSLDRSGTTYDYIDVSTVEGMAEAAYREIMGRTLPVAYVDGVERSYEDLVRSEAGE